jgi:Leucine-rich repeat (LRR) protein
MKKIKYLPIALVATICFYSCSDDDKAAGIPVTGIEVTEATADGLTVKALETARLTVTVSPENASYKRVLFESINTEIMSVTQDGVIKGLKTGTTTLRVFAADGGGASVDYPVYVDYEASVTNVKNPGTLSQLLAGQNGITSLKLAGTLNNADFETLTGLTALQTLDLSLTTVTAIPDNAFYPAGSTETLALASVILPATVASVGENAFRKCTNLTSVTLNALTPPETAVTAFGETDRETIQLTVPNESYEAYREAEVYGKMTINGVEPAGKITILKIPAASAVGQWQTVTLDPALSTSDEWTIVSVNTQPTDDINKVQFGESGWGVHLFSIDFTGSVSGKGSPPFEFYLGGTSQSGTKIGAIGRGNWNSSTQNLTPYAIALNKPVTITLTCAGDGSISCTVQNEGVNDGEPVDFGTMTGVETVTVVKAAVPVETTVTVTMKE